MAKKETFDPKFDGGSIIACDIITDLAADLSIETYDALIKVKGLVKVAIVGKPNVGKSTLFNKLCRRNLAIVNDRPGVTRDRKIHEATLGDLEFLLVDTAGWEFVDRDTMVKDLMRQQTTAAVADADVILFVVDAREGINPHDIEFAAEIRKHAASKTILVANKSESSKRIDAGDLFSLGLGEPVFVSSAHGLGLDQLYVSLSNFISADIPDNDWYYKKKRSKSKSREKENAPTKSDALTTKNDPMADINLAIVGRPNVGKSTLFNKIIGYDRVIVADAPGTTRDAITETIGVGDRNIVLIDTAGIRKRCKVEDIVESNSLGQSITAIRRANVIVLMMDARNPLEKQDLAIAKIAVNEGKGLIVAINKCDLIEDIKLLQEQVTYTLQHVLNDLAQVFVVYLTAITGRNVDRLLRAAELVHSHWQTKISTSDLNRWLRGATSSYIPPTTTHGRRIKIKYITQKASRPPTFYLNANAELPGHYERYLKKSLSQCFQLRGTPIRFVVKKSDNPYD